jgi:hypothetical protein
VKIWKVLSLLIVSILVAILLASDYQAGTIDLGLTNANITIYGDDANDRLGEAVASGDINNDGFDDIIIGVPKGDGFNESFWSGETYVIYGSANYTLDKTFDLNLTNANITIYGDAVNDWSGYAVASEDINNDGIDDIIIGATGGGVAGQTYVIYGSNSYGFIKHLI